MEITNIIRKTDSKVADAIELEVKRQRSKIELIASENFVSEAVLQAVGSPLTNKYAEGYPGRRYYGGCECVDIVEDIARDRAKAIFGCDHANVQPHSGANANTAVYFAMLQPGDTILGMSLAHGGHLSHGSPVNISGKYFNIVSYGVDDDTHTINYDKVRELALEQKSYAKLATQYSEELYKLLKVTSPSKWFNILVLYVKLTKCVLEKIDISITLEDGSYNSSNLIYDLDLYTAYWHEHPSAEIARHILSRINIIYDKSSDVRDTIAIYREYINDNFDLIINYLDNFYNEILTTESKRDRRFKELCDSYHRETDRLRNRYLPRRIFETVLANSHLINNMQDLPYIGKK